MVMVRTVKSAPKLANLLSTRFRLEYFLQCNK